MDDIERLLAKNSIQDALARYCRGIDRLDADLAKSAYHSTSQDEHGPIRGSGHEVIDRVLTGLKRLHATHHQVASSTFEFLADGAVRVETYFFALHVEAEIEDHVYGRYLDRFEKRGGAWRIASRRVVVDYTASQPRGAPYAHEHHFTRGIRGPEDPSYQA